MKYCNISRIRDLARRLDISHNTILDWLLPLKITRKKYSSLLNQGYTPTKIYRLLRGNKELPSEGETYFDNELIRFHKTVRGSIRMPNYSKDTKDITLGVINDLNRFLMKIEEDRKIPKSIPAKHCT